MHALIVDDGFDRGTIAAARALHEDGWTVGIGSPVRGVAGASRACAHWHRFPLPERGVGAFLDAVNGAIDAAGYEIVLAGDDFRLLVLSQHRDLVEAAVPYARHEVVVRAVDKLELTLAAKAVGLAAPHTVEATSAALATVRLPVIVKPALHDASGRVRPILATTREQAAAHAVEIRNFGGKPLLQQRIQGGLMAYTFVADHDSSIVASIQQRDLHTWPPTIGVSARAEAVPTDPELAEAVARLARELEWFGLAQLQFLKASGRPPALIDLNARPYGSLPLATAAGMNLPAIWARLGTGRPLGPISPPRLGATFQWFPGDVRASMAEHGTYRGALEALRMAPHASQAIWRLGDPWPFVRHYSLSALSRFRPGGEDQPEPEDHAPGRPAVGLRDKEPV